MDKIAKALGGGEGGAGGGSFVIRVNKTEKALGTKYELDKTWQEIRDAIEAGMYCCIVNYIPADEDSGEMVPVHEVLGSLYIYDGKFGLVDAAGDWSKFSADAMDGYPYCTLIPSIDPAPGDMKIVNQI